MALTSDPLPTSTALRRFLGQSPCPFAQRAHVLSCSPWPDPRPLPRRVDDLHTRLLELTRPPENDLLVLEIDRADLLRTPNEAAGVLHGLLRSLRDRDPLCPLALTAGIESHDWDFEHGGENFFISLFAPLYPSSHSRWSGDDSVGFVLFQPERSFRRFGVSSRRPARERLSRAVHRRFNRAGQDYDIVANGHTPKAMRFVKPLGKDDSPIAWWRVPYEADAG